MMLFFIYLSCSWNWIYFPRSPLIAFNMYALMRGIDVVYFCDSTHEPTRHFHSDETWKRHTKQDIRSVCFILLLFLFAFHCVDLNTHQPGRSFHHVNHVTPGCFPHRNPGNHTEPPCSRVDSKVISTMDPGWFILLLLDSLFITRC